jgi:hypothetical protein
MLYSTAMTMVKKKMHEPSKILIWGKFNLLYITSFIPESVCYIKRFGCLLLPCGKLANSPYGMFSRDKSFFSRARPEDGTNCLLLYSKHLPFGSSLTLCALQEGAFELYSTRKGL